MKISNVKREKISEQILVFLYSINPKPAFTSHIADEIARDEEFVKQLLIGLKNKNLIKNINKNPSGKLYKKRMRWVLSDSTYKIYKNQQIKFNM